MSYTEMLGEKGNTLRVIGNFKYAFHKRLRNGIHRWSCTAKNCKCFVKFNRDATIAEVDTRNHNHTAPTDDTLRREKFSITSLHIHGTQFGYSFFKAPKSWDAIRHSILRDAEMLGRN